jgi:hypothetical protein
VRAHSTSAEQTVRAQDDRELVAALNRDVSALEALWSEQFTVNAPNNQVVVGRQQNLDTFVRGGVINFSSFERTIEFVRVDGDFAVIMGLETVVPRADAPPLHKHLEARGRHVASLLAPCERHPVALSATPRAPRLAGGGRGSAQAISREEFVQRASGLTGR